MDAPTTADQHYHNAIKALGSEDVGEAMDQLNDAIDDDPDHLEALLLRGKLQLHRRNLVAAEGDFMQVIRQEQEHAEAVFLRGFARFLRGAYREAMADLNQAILLQPDYFSAYYQRGNLHLTLGDAASAKPDYEKALEIEPESPQVLTNLATVHAELGELETAEHKLNEALSINHDYTEALYGRAEIFLLTDRYQEALSDVDVLLDQGMEEAALYRLKAQALGGLGDIDKALANFEAAIQASDVPADQYHERADFNLYFDRHKEALEDYAKVIELQPDNPEAWFGQAQAKIMLLDAEGAEKDLRQSLELRPNDPDVITALADLLAAMHRPEEAQAIRATLPEGAEEE